MANTSNIRQGMEVVGSDSGYIGKVDKLEGKSIRLAHEDPGAGPEVDYHFIPFKWVKSVDDVVHLDRSVDDATHQWETARAVK